MNHHHSPRFWVGSVLSAEAMMAAFGPVSGGHFNPAVSVAMPLELRKMVAFHGNSHVEIMGIYYVWISIVGIYKSIYIFHGFSWK